ncbi:hypothetical protein [Dyadobacter soli]|nr:hypothetical protein [Dyadobacter soli]
MKVGLGISAEKAWNAVGYLHNRAMPGDKCSSGCEVYAVTVFDF